MSATFSQLPLPRAVFYFPTGAPLVGGFVYTYVPGGTTPKTTYQNAQGTLANANPIVLDSAGSCLLYGAGNYQITVTDALGNAIPAYSGLTVGLGMGFVFVTDFGATGVSPTIDTPAFQSALNSMTAGGTVIMPPGYDFQVNSIAIPPGVTLQGPYGDIGAPGMANFTPPYAALSSLRLTSAATITLNGGGCIKGAFIAPQNMTFPQADASGFVGTAITVNGDDTTVRDCMILGFAQIYTSTGFSRCDVRDCKFDGVACIYISGSSDVCRIIDTHCWPWGTIQPGAPGTALNRSGKGIAFETCQDASKAIGCFVYAYAQCYEVNNSGGIQLTSCSADSTSTSSFGIGFNIVGYSADTSLDQCQASGQGVCGFYATVTIANVLNRLIDCGHNGNSTGILIDTDAAGDVMIIGGVSHDEPIGITVASATPNVMIDYVTFYNNSTIPIDVTAATTLARIGEHCVFGTLSAGSPAAGANLGLPVVASAATVELPPTGDTFTISGTTNFSNLAGGWAGRVVTLIFDAVLTITNTFDDVTTHMRLANASNFTTAAGSTLVLEHNGNQWFQIGGVV
jgi:hypothetical protein